MEKKDLIIRLMKRFRDDLGRKGVDSFVNIEDYGEDGYWLGIMIYSPASGDTLAILDITEKEEDQFFFDWDDFKEEVWRHLTMCPPATERKLGVFFQ